MPIITAYSGSISLRASEGVNDEPFYVLSKTVYGMTLGELFDNLVEASVKVSRAAQLWAFTNESAEYSLTDGYWRLAVTLPDIIKCQQKTIPENVDSTFDSRVLSFEEIVRNAVAHRDINIHQANTYLQLAMPGHSELPESPFIPFFKISEAATLEDMTEFGWIGEDLDSILEVAERENRITAHQAFCKYEDRLSTFELMMSSPREESGENKRKKRMWIF